MKIFSAVLILGFFLITPVFAHENVNNAGSQDCEKYIFDERFYKNAALYAYEAEKRYSITFPNLFWFSQKARDARSDYELCKAGVVLGDN
ncbi:MAG: hypothetical protein UV01_C0002G0069 [Parcubacteria group bacterium GW2011_GWA2_42_14]|nr:MAG: hypothetical protein UV01_C0002G0069 [Parcubacteria group bacterium GW2011_GWA2_42_14]OGZ98751.1 MAG: hypothetical protein A3D41_05825 [Candidatus Sungbacteria bacterium RIFCSPHIGHO2_02_FULL_41_12b]